MTAGKYYLNPWVFPGIFGECAMVMTLVTKKTGFTYAQLAGQSREREIVYARHVFCYICYVEKKINSKRIGRFLGSRDHSTIFSSIKQVKDCFDVRNSELLEVYKQVKG